MDPILGQGNRYSFEESQWVCVKHIYLFQKHLLLEPGGVLCRNFPAVFRTLVLKGFRLDFFPFQSATMNFYENFVSIHNIISSID